VLGLGVAGAAAFWSCSAGAQEGHSKPFAYIFGIAEDQELVGPTKLLQGVGVPDVSIRAYLHNVSWLLTHIESSIVKLRRLRLYNPALPMLVWDTDPNTRWPLIAVTYNGDVVNRADGSIDGLAFPNHVFLELFVWDPGDLARRRAGFVLDVTTPDGTLPVPVEPSDVNDRSYTD